MQGWYRSQETRLKTKLGSQGWLGRSWSISKAFPLTARSKGSQWPYTGDHDCTILSCFLDYFSRPPLSVPCLVQFLDDFKKPYHLSPRYAYLDLFLPHHTGGTRHIWEVWQPVFTFRSITNKVKWFYSLSVSLSPPPSFHFPHHLFVYMCTVCANGCMCICGCAVEPRYYY